MKYIFQIVNQPKNIMEFTKFLLYFKVDDDPEIFELLSDRICRHMTAFKVDELLTVLVNLSQTLSPEVVEVFKLANLEFVERLDDNYDPEANQSYI